MKVPLKVYNMLDREVDERRIIEIKISDIPSLQFINSLILKIEMAKKRNNAEEFQMLQAQLKE